MEPIKKELSSKTRAWWVSSRQLLVLVRGNVKTPTLVRKIQAYGRSDRVGYSTLLFSWRFPCSIAGEYSQEWHRTRFPRCATPYMMTSDGDLLPWVILAKHTNTSAPREMSLPINTNTDNIHTTNHMWVVCPLVLREWRTTETEKTSPGPNRVSATKPQKPPKKLKNFLISKKSQIF